MCRANIYTYCRHPPASFSELCFESSEVSICQKQTLVNAKNLKNRSSHRLICQQLIANNLWNDGAKIMKSFETCKKSRHFFFYSLADCANYADFFITQRYILPLIALIYADLLCLADCADYANFLFTQRYIFN